MEVLRNVAFINTLAVPTFEVCGLVEHLITGWRSILCWWLRAKFDRGSSHRICSRSIRTSA
jgi:hypothetical protein